MRLLLNAANLHAGGGVAVATSVIDAISRMGDLEDVITVLASSEVHRNLESMGTDLGGFAAFHVFDQQGIRALWQSSPVAIGDFPVVLNLFGPVYSLAAARRSVMGFAQPWIAFPDNLAYRNLRVSGRIATRVSYAVKTLFFLLARELVVEQEQVRSGLCRQFAFRRKRISVISSVVDSVYFDPRRWEPVDLPPGDDVVRLGVIARNYPHKNLKVLPAVKRALLEEHGIRSAIYVTLPPQDWEDTSEDFKQQIANVGPLRLGQCPTFNRQMDAIVFPTLLECFSATPIEARAVGTPLFASDLPVVRETVGDYAHYFDPLDPADIAATVARGIKHGSGARSKLAGCWSPSGSPYSAEDRARQLLDLCRQADRTGAGIPMHRYVKGRP